MNKPIFIVGCPSSGTTLLASIVGAHPNISLGQETDVLIHFNQIFEQPFWKKIEDYGFSQQYWNEQFAALFDKFKTDYAEKSQKQRWADKSPCYTPHINLLSQLFPESQFIHLIRDGRDVVASHRKRWGYKTALKGIWLWKEYVQKARQDGRDLSPQRYLEIRYEDLVAEPEGVSKNIFKYLDEPWDHCVLNYNKSKSFYSVGEYANLTEKRRAETGEEALVYKSRVGTGTKLDPLLKGLIYTYGGSLLKELGYT